jgi:uncharacterized lipoprotein YajG
MKKVLFALITIVMIGACNSPQKMSGTGSDSTNMMNSTDTNSTMNTDTTARRDSM